jgi:hypothetical protein
LSQEEVLYLAETLDLSESPILSPGFDADPTRGVVRRALLARRLLLVGTDGKETVVDPVDWILRLAIAPGLLARATRVSSGVLETRSFAAIPDASVEQAELSEGLLRFTPFPTPEFPARILGFLELETRPEFPLSPFTVPLSAISRCGKTLEERGTDAAASVLQELGVEQTSARGFVSALHVQIQSAHVLVVHRSSEVTIEGGDIAWIDGGSHGLWLTSVPSAFGFVRQVAMGAPEPTQARQAADDVDLLVEVSPTTAQEIARQLFEALPGRSADAPA